MSDLQRVLSLVQTAMDEFDAPGTTLAGLVRRCQRIASLRGDAISLVWLDLEARDVSHEYQAGVEARADSLATRLIASLPPAVASEGFRVEYRAYLVRRRLRSDGEESSLDSVQQIEEKVRLLREQEAQLAPPPPGMHSYDLGKYVAEQQALRATLLAARPLFESILARVKDRLWVFLNETEHELTFGEAATETFDRLRSYVDGQLTTIAPLALEQFQTAYRRLNDGGSEDRAHAVTSCRRVLKTLADELYPARVEPVAGVDGKKHVLTDEAFVNRLLQYVSEAVGKHENGAVVQVDPWIRLDRSGGVGELGELEEGGGFAGGWFCPAGVELATAPASPRGGPDARWGSGRGVWGSVQVARGASLPAGCELGGAGVVAASSACSGWWAEGPGQGESPSRLGCRVRS